MLAAWGRRLLGPLALVLAVVAARAVGGGWYYFTRYLPAQRSATEEAMQTSRVRRGSLIISAGGSGTLIPGSQAYLGFSAGELVTEVPVEVGDWVENAQVLALLFRNPGLTSSEIFGTLFDLQGSMVQFALLGIVMVAALAIRRPRCGFLRTLRPVFDYVRFMRSWVKGLVGALWARATRAV